MTHATASLKAIPQAGGGACVNGCGRCTRSGPAGGGRRCIGWWRATGLPQPPERVRILSRRDAAMKNYLIRSVAVVTALAFLAGDAQAGLWSKLLKEGGEFVAGKMGRQA